MGKPGLDTWVSITGPKTKKPQAEFPELAVQMIFHFMITIKKSCPTFSGLSNV